MILPLVVGLFLGIMLEKNMGSLTSPSSSLLRSAQRSTATTTTTGIVKTLSEIEHRPTSHVDTQGRPITKQQLLEPFVIPNYAGFSVATFLPGQTLMPLHEHETMHEFFYVLKGEGLFQIDDQTYEVKPGMFLHLAPKEKHGIWVPDDKTEPLKMAVSGVTID